jgi:hypothetical protein
MVLVLGLLPKQVASVMPKHMPQERTPPELFKSTSFVSMLATEARLEDTRADPARGPVVLAQPYNSTYGDFHSRSLQFGEGVFFVALLVGAAASLATAFTLPNSIDETRHKTALELGELNVVSARGDTELCFEVVDNFNNPVEAHRYLTIKLENAVISDSAIAGNKYRVDVRPRHGTPKVDVSATRDMYGYKILVTSIYGRRTSLVLSETNSTHMVKAFDDGLGTAHLVDGLELTDIKGEYMWEAGSKITSFEMDLSNAADVVDRVINANVATILDSALGVKEKYGKLTGTSGRRLASVQLYSVRLYIANTNRGPTYVRIYSYGDEFDPGVCRIEGDAEWSYERSDYLFMKFSGGDGTAPEAYVELITRRPTIYRVVLAPDGYGAGVGVIATMSVHEGNQMYTYPTNIVASGISGFKTSTEDSASMYIAAY